MNTAIPKFYGDNLNEDDYDLILATRWSDALRKKEPALYKSCWFDYRSMPIVKKTYLYGEIFIRETRAIIRAHVDNTPPRMTASGRFLDWQPLKDGDIFEPPAKAQTYWKRKINSLIRARQWADKIGAPYEIIIRAALRHWYFGRYYFIEQKTLPEPGMFNGEDCQHVMLEKWISSLDSKIQYSSDERFKFDGSEDFPDRLVHEEWILNQISRKSQPRFAIKKFTDMALIRSESAVKRFGVVV